MDIALRILNSGYGSIVIGFTVLSIIAIVMQKKGKEIHPTLLFALHMINAAIGLFFIIKSGV
jgi:uncharacterized membrane protein YgaE (UPF0421/DUF939 family)